MSFIRLGSLKTLLCAAFCFGMTSCVSGDSEVKLVVVPPGPSEVHLGETLVLQASDPAVIWNVLGEPETGNIDAFGLYQAPLEMPADPQVIVLASRGDETFYVLIRLVE